MAFLIQGHLQQVIYLLARTVHYVLHEPYQILYVSKVAWRTVYGMDYIAASALEDLLSPH